MLHLCYHVSRGAHGVLLDAIDFVLEVLEQALNAAIDRF